MCFCATGSFAASGVLVVAGAATLAVAESEELMLALLPIFFAVQQAIEGWQWLVPHPSAQSAILGKLYLFFAFVFWPVYIPWMVHSVESDKHRRGILRWFIAIGLMLSLVLLGFLILKPVDVVLHPLGIFYSIDVPPLWELLAWYVLATCGSMLVSSRKGIRWLGFVTFLAVIMALAISLGSYVSVWCFFSALLSLFVYFVVDKKVGT